MRLVDAGAWPVVAVDGGVWLGTGFDELVRVPVDALATGSDNWTDVPDRAVVVRADVRYLDAAGCSQPECTVRLDAYSPSTGARSPMAVLVPGAPSTPGSRRYLALLASALASRGVVAITVDYRSSATGSPDAQAVADVACAVGFARSHAVEFGGDPSHVVLIGHSFGGRIVVEVGRSKPAPGDCSGASEPLTLVVALAATSDDLHVPLKAKSSETRFRLYTGSEDMVVPPCTGLAAELNDGGYETSCETIEGADHIAIWDPRSSIPTFAKILDLVRQP